MENEIVVLSEKLKKELKHDKAKSKVYNDYLNKNYWKFIITKKNFIHAFLIYISAISIYLIFSINTFDKSLFLLIVITGPLFSILIKYISLNLEELFINSIKLSMFNLLMNEYHMSDLEYNITIKDLYDKIIELNTKIDRWFYEILWSFAYIENIFNWFNVEERLDTLAQLILESVDLQCELNLDTPDTNSRGCYDANAGLNYLGVTKVGLMVFADHIHKTYIAGSLILSSLWNSVMPGKTLVDVVDMVWGFGTAIVGKVKDGIKKFTAGIKAGLSFIADTIKGVLNAAVELILTGIVSAVFFSLSSLLPKVAYEIISGKHRLTTSTNLILELFLSSDSNGVYIEMRTDLAQDTKVVLNDAFMLNSIDAETLSPQGDFVSNIMVHIFSTIAVMASAYQAISGPSIAVFNTAWVVSIMAQIIMAILTLNTYTSSQDISDFAGLMSMYYSAFGLSSSFLISNRAKYYTHGKSGDPSNSATMNFNKNGDLDERFKHMKDVIKVIGENKANSLASFFRETAKIFYLQQIIGFIARKFSIMTELGDMVSALFSGNWNYFDSMAITKIISLVLGGIMGIIPLYLAFPNRGDEATKKLDTTRFMAYGSGLLIYSIFGTIMGALMSFISKYPTLII